MAIDPRNYDTSVVLRDGSSIRIRAIRPDDKERLTEHFNSLSERSVYFRFFSAKKRLTDEELVRFTEPDFVTHVALVATRLEDGKERIIGVGRYIIPPHGDPRRAEVAFAVADAYQGKGIGTALLEHLASIARERGVTEFEANVLGENNQMLEVFARSGFRVARTVEGGIVHVSFPTEETVEFRAAAETRERQAIAESIRPFFYPRSVAVIGASNKPNTVGHALVKNLKDCGFHGPIYPVNPRYSEIAGLRAYAKITDIGGPVDLAVIAVPAPTVEAVVSDCARVGVRAVVVISAGFGESGPTGREREQALRQLVRNSGMRMVGPNCLGLLNTDPEVSLNATFAPTFPPRGNISMLSQSGALGIAILDTVSALGVGIATFVSVGNKADVSGNDLLCYWFQDPTTRVILLYLESFGNPRKFARIAPLVAREKPIIAMKSGRSAAGTRAAASHSAALASLDVAVDALFEQAGVMRTNTLEEMFDVAALLSTQPVPPGPRVGVVTNAGGPGILLADACEAEGLQLPELGEATREQLRTFLPPQASVANPVDIIASATPEQFERSLEVVGNDPAVDAVVAIYIPLFLTQVDETAAAIARGAGRIPEEKPVLTVFLSSRGIPPRLAQGPRGPLPSFRFPEDAARALAKAWHYRRWRERPRGEELRLDRFAESTIRAVVDRVLQSATEPVWVDEHDTALILKAAGIPVAEGETVPCEEALEAAERLGYPLVMKAQIPGLVHKSDVGGVILNIFAAQQVEAAVAEMKEDLAQHGYTLERVLLQRQIMGGHEAMVGVVTDPTFGPLLVCGLGGVLVELLRDVRFRLTPVTDVDAREMVESLRTAPLLTGYRGMPPGDKEALIRLVQRVSALVEVVPELRELDLNPVKVLPPGQGVVVVDTRMRLAPA
ncbi:MAG: GNAT family N-acetyltransferase [Candidatus Binatia bacterium]|nr:GNAT family N-acetyltransferase [Candidatus Binatia bacterium]